MRTISFLILGTLLFFVLIPTNGFAHKSYSISIGKSLCLDNIDIDIKNGTLVLVNKQDEDEIVEITEDYILYVNGKHISTDYRQNMLIKDYYDQFMDIIDCAKEVGWEGARVGLEGAKVGLKATVGLLKVIFTRYKTEDLEEYLEEETEELEEKADELKEKAQEIEEMAEEFKELHHELKENIPELQKLKWF